MKKILVTCLFMLQFVMVFGQYQDKDWFFIRAKDTLVTVDFRKENDKLVYKGNDAKLKAVLANHTIHIFKKTYRNANLENLKKTFFVVTEDAKLLEQLLTKTSHLFIGGELIADEDKKIFEPNDYGLTSTIGNNIGAQANLDYLDFLEAPKAWYYTTGHKDVIVGISDGLIDTTNIEFKGKTKVFQKSSVANGHGVSQAGNAAAQGDNGYGIPGICYDCSIYGTRFGGSNTMAAQLELSRAGAKVINCSWISSRYYQTAQDAIYEMYLNGTIMVASAGNHDWNRGKQGELLLYPASYDKVISVGSGMYKYPTPADNTRVIKDRNIPYVENIRGYVGRTAGYVDNDVSKGIDKIYPISVARLNKQVDLLAPTAGLFSLGKLVMKDSISYSRFETTSGASPQVSGTIGLMYSLNPCLPIDEVESILKVTAYNIDHLKVNEPYKGNYGAGLLQTGKAVELVYQLYSEEETAIIQDQDLARWDFTLRSFAKETIIKNQSFTESATLQFTSKNNIILKPGTHLKPNNEGKIALSINPDMARECDLRLRDESIRNK